MGLAAPNTLFANDSETTITFVVAAVSVSANMRPDLSGIFMTERYAASTKRPLATCRPFAPGRTKLIVKSTPRNGTAEVSPASITPGNGAYAIDQIALKRRERRRRSIPHVEQAHLDREHVVPVEAEVDAVQPPEAREQQAG